MDYNRELYPPCLSEEPALLADEWIGGETKAPLRREISDKPDAPEMVDAVVNDGGNSSEDQ